MAAVVSYIASALISVGVPEAIATFAAKVALVEAANLAANALTKKSYSDAASRLLDPSQYNQLNADPLSDRVIIYGETGIAGEIVFQIVHPDKQWISYVVALADCFQPIGHELTGFTADGDAVTFVGGHATGHYSGVMNLRFYGGTLTQTADAQLITDSGGVWTSAHRGRGVCYAVWSIKLSDQDKFPNGRPSPIFKIKGRRLYDRRLDSTAGGSGAHRIDDPATWEWSDNAAVVADDFMRGIFVTLDDDTEKRLAGLGLPLDLIDDAKGSASANACDTEGWTINGPVNTSDDPTDVLKTFALHMGGRIATRKGKLAVVAASADWPIVCTIGEDDLAGSLKITAAKPWRDVHNAVKGTYRDVTNNYEAVETALVEVADWIEQDDGQVFEKAVSLPFSSDRELSTRLAKLDLFRERAPRTIEGSFKLRVSQAIEADFVEVNFPSYGLSDTYEVTSWTLDQTGFVNLTLDLYNPDGLDWSSEEAGDPPDWGAFDRTALTPDQPEDWDADGVSDTSGGGSVPAIDIFGVAPDWIDTVIFEWRIHGTSAWTLWSEGNAKVTGTRITGLAPSLHVDVSVTYRSGTRVSERLILDVTTPSTFIAPSSGVSDSIVGQGALATLNNVAIGTGGRVYRDDGSTHLTDATAVTSLGTAAGIASQGALATLSIVALGSGGRVYRDDGSTHLTDSLAITSLGTAAAIAAQGALATLSLVALGIGGRVYRDDGSTHLTDAIAVTSLGTAAAILAQGALATLSAINGSYVDANSLTSDLMAVGGALNAADNGNFQQGQIGWSTPAGAVVTDAPNAYVGDKYFLVSNANQSFNTNVFSVVPGEYLRLAGVAKRLAAGSGGDFRLRLRYIDASASLVSATELIWSSETSYTLKAAISTVPATAAKCQIALLGNSLAGGRTFGVGAVWVDRVTVSGSHIVSSSGSVLGDADIITLSGTASAITSQGALATLSLVALGASGRVYRDDGSTHLTDAIAVTSLGTASAIAAQGALATLSLVALGTGGRVYRDDGATHLTDALAVTTLGVASGFSGQGALATMSSVAAGFIDALAVTAASLANWDASNFIRDPLFSDVTQYWALGSGVTVSTSSEITSNLGASQGVDFSGTGQASGAQVNVNPRANYYAPVEPGQSYRLSACSRWSIGFTGQCQLLVDYFDQSGGTISSGNGVAYGTDFRTVAASSAASQNLSGIITTPSNCRFVRFRQKVVWSTTLSNAGHLYGALPSIQRALGSELVAAGAIFLGSGGTVFRDDGSTHVTDAIVITSLGTASGITSQGPLATQTPPSYAGNAAALAAGLKIGQSYLDSSDSNKLKTVAPASLNPGAPVTSTFADTITSTSATSIDTINVTVTTGGKYRFTIVIASGDTSSYSGGTSSVIIDIADSVQGTLVSAVAAAVITGTTVTLTGSLSLPYTMYAISGASGSRTLTLKMRKLSGGQSNYDVSGSWSVEPFAP